MDFPMIEVELVSEKEKLENEKVANPSFRCDLYDVSVVQKIAEAFLPGLASACVDNTTGDMFRSAGSVAADIRKEMVDYLTQRSENFVAESIVLEDGPDSEVSDHPYDIVSDFVDDFASSKRNLFSRVSGWLLSDSREDNIDDFAQEMEINGFWLMDKRESLAHVLLKNVDLKNAFHCDEKFRTTEELSEHVANCGFRSMNCDNEGCTATFSARHLEDHDSACPFKIIPCEQQCSSNIMRREMDRHCVTVCPMKNVTCPFYSVGCLASVPQSKIQQHRSDALHSHLAYVLKAIHKDASEEFVKQRAVQLMQAFTEQLAAAKDVRSLMPRVKDSETKIGPLQVISEKASSESDGAANNVAQEPNNVASNASLPTESTRETSEKSPDVLNKVGEELGENLKLDPDADQVQN